MSTREFTAREALDELIRRHGATETCRMLGIRQSTAAQLRRLGDRLDRLADEPDRSCTEVLQKPQFLSGDDTDRQVRSLFEEVVAEWDEPLRCQTGQSPRPCRNRAAWLAVQHEPCGHKLVCTYHYKRWLKRNLLNLVVYEDFGCPDCHQRFTSIEQFARFRRL